jgi:FMN phosphatase YigB (HAD superfamily)/DNA-binding XRE family transcriptional regulator
VVNALDEKRLGKRLQDARRAAGFTQQMLCQQANLSYSTLAKIERGAIKSPSIFTVQTIAAALGVSLDELLGVASVGRSALPKKVSKSGVRFVYFDINGCLVRFFHQAFTKIADETDTPPDVVETAFWHYNDDVCRGTMSLSDFNAAFAKKVGVPSLDWQKYYLEAVEPIVAAQELVEWASKHYHVGLLTNIMPGFVNAMRTHKLLPNVSYDAIVDSSQVGAIKPEEKIFNIATERTGCQPEEILFIDDSRANVMAAERFGWHVLWFDDYRPQESVERIRKALEPAE